jgi:hypothetical protein
MDDLLNLDPRLIEALSWYSKSESSKKDTHWLLDSLGLDPTKESLQFITGNALRQMYHAGCHIGWDAARDIAPDPL